MAQAVLPWSLGSVGWRQSCQLTMQKRKIGDAACPALVVTSDWAVRENTSIGRRGLERRLFRIKSTTAALPNVPSSVASTHTVAYNHSLYNSGFREFDALF